MPSAFRRPVPGTVSGAALMAPLLAVAVVAAGCADRTLADLEPLAACVGGAADEYGCAGVELLAVVSVAELGGGALSDLWGWTDPATGREYGLVGRAGGTAFVDVTDPTAPRVVGELPLTAGASPSSWRDIKVYADHALVVSDNAGPHGMQVFDLRRLRGAEGGPVTFEADAVYRGIAGAHNVVVDPASGLAATVGSSGGEHSCGGGLHMLDVSDPVHPVFLGCYLDVSTGRRTGYTHDAQCVTYRGPDTRFTGRRICLGSNVDALSIVDVTDPAHPVPLAAAGYPAAGYLHQGWLTDDHRHFYMNDESDELFGSVDRTRTLVWDLEVLDDPVLVTQHEGVTGSTDHNLYVLGDVMYQANYTSGLRVLDISDRAAPVEVGFFDTVGHTDEPGFAGAWSVYPFFESGTLLVSSIGEGLFVVRMAP